MSLPIIVSTSNAYLHLIPVFCYLFNKYWSDEQQVTILGYDKPLCKLPSNFTFVSMGEQGFVSEWSSDLRRYFEFMPDKYFIWLMEDTLLRREVTDSWKEIDQILSRYRVGRFDLTNDIQKRGHSIVNNTLVKANDNTNYRLSTMPSVWNREYLLRYLTPGLSPWAMEKQSSVNDGWHILGFTIPPIKANEGVRKDDPHKLDLNGFSQEDIDHINTLL